MDVKFVRLENVYYLTDEEIHRLYKQIADNYFYDDLYCTIFKSETSRKWALPYLFRHYIKAIRPFCHFVADSSDLNSVMVVYDSSLDTSILMRLRYVLFIFSLIPLAFGVHSISSIHHAIDCIDMFLSFWMKDFVSADYYSVDLFYTKREARHAGYGTKVIESVIQNAKLNHFDVALETHRSDHVSIYEKFGFRLMGNITHEEYNVSKYCMLLKTSEG